MLILTRRIGESLQIGDNIKLTVLSIRGNQVQVGVEAPVEIPVHRQEVYERIQREQNAGNQNSGAGRPLTRFLRRSRTTSDR